MRRDAGMDLVEIRIVCLVILVLALIAIPLALPRMKAAQEVRATLDCLSAGKPCSDGHRERALPAPLDAEEVEGRGVRVRVEREGGLLRLHVKNSGSYLWGLGGFIAFLGLIGTVGSAFTACTGGSKGEWAWAALSLLVALGFIGYVHRTTSFGFEGRRVTRVVRVLGVRTSSAVHEVQALAVPADNTLYALKKDAPPLEIVALPEASLGLASRLKNFFEGR